MNDKLTLPARRTAKGLTGNIPISPEAEYRLRELNRVVDMTLTQLASRLLLYAMDRVEVDSDTVVGSPRGRITCQFRAEDGSCTAEEIG